MTISPDLFLSILSMDAYNRGYNPGIEGLSGTSIGNAAILNVPLPQDAQPAGFYAIAYNLGGETIISYRGTDDFGGIFSELTLVDLPLSFLGGYTQTQIALASKFFKAVDAANGSASMLLTGHSLGDGLAGGIAKLKTRCRAATRHPNPGYQIHNAHDMGVDFK